MSDSSMKLIMQIGPLVLLIALMYFMLIRPQKKKEKEVNAMRAALQVGDSIVTIGGICGKVVKIKDDTIVIQVGADKVKFEMMKWAISQVVSSKATKLSSRNEDAEEARKPKRLKKAEKEEVLDVVPEPIEETKPEAVEAEPVESVENEEQENSAEEK